MQNQFAYLLNSELMTNDELSLPDSFNNATLEMKMPFYITDGA